MGRTPCCSAETIKKGAWTSEEDQKLISYIQLHGEGRWRTLPQKAGLQRCGKSCRLRWANYLRPDIRRGEFSPEEEQKIIELHATLGNRWSAIAKQLSRRTDNEIKNYWNTHLKKKLAEKVNHDLATHKPIDVATLSNINNDNISDSSSNNDEAKFSNSTHNKVSQREIVDQLRSSVPPSPSARLLNKLAANRPPFRCLDALRNQCQCFQSPPPPLPPTTIELDSSIDDQDVIETSPPNKTFRIEPPINLRPVSASARLLNKMASRVSTPVHSIDALKSILSKSMIESGGGGDTGDGGCESSKLSEVTSKIPKSNILTSTTTTRESTNEMGIDNLEPLMDPFDLDLIKYWERVLWTSFDDERGGVGGECDHRGGVSNTSVFDTNYNIESPISSHSFLVNNESPFSIACELSESELFDFWIMELLP